MKRMNLWMLFTILLLLIALPAMAGLKDRQSLIELEPDPDNFILGPELSANPSGNPATGWWRVFGVANALYFEADDGTVTNLITPSVTSAWDDIGNPDANDTITFSTYTATFTGTSTAADQFNFINTGNFGDISVVKIQQTTGNPTDGTLLEVTTGDTNADGVVISNSTADLTADNRLLTLSLTDDGDANGIFMQCYDNAGGDSKFQIAADGNTTVGGTLACGDTTITGTLAVSGTASLGTILMDAVTAATGGQTLALNGAGVGGVNICAVSTGGITLSDDVAVADTKDVTIGEGVLTVDNDQINETAVVITSDATTAGGAIGITSAITTTNGKALSITANDATTGDLVYLESSAAGMTTGNFVNCYNGAATVFEVGLYGATTIAGNAATDIITMTAGNLQMTNGDIDMDDGKIEIDTTTNEYSYVKRNQGVTTTPVVEIEETAAAADNPALLIDQNATAATSYGLEIDSAGGTCALINCEAVTGDGITFSTPASYTGQLVTVNDTLVGTNGEGIIDIKTTANMATGATLVRLDADTGTLVAATDGFLLSVDDDSGAQATSYAVLIDSASNEALHVATGKALFDEQPTFTSGIACNGDIATVFSTNAEEQNISATATDYAAGSGIVTVFSNNAGATNATYLLRLVNKTDGDAQDHFLLCQDNSTGAAGNGDEKFSVSTEGLTKALAGISPGNATDSVLKTDTVELSNANIKALRATPKTLVTAPGANTFVEVDSVVLILDYGSEALTESTDNLVVQYNTSGTDITGTIETTGFIDQIVDQMAIIYPTSIATMTAGNAINRAVELFNTGDGEFAGNASNDTTMTVKITYRLHAAGL